MVSTEASVLLLQRATRGSQGQIQSAQVRHGVPLPAGNPGPWVPKEGHPFVVFLGPFSGVLAKEATPAGCATETLSARHRAGEVKVILWDILSLIWHSVSYILSGGRRPLCGGLAARQWPASSEARRFASAPWAAWQSSTSLWEGDVFSSQCVPGLQSCSVGLSVRATLVFLGCGKGPHRLQRATSLQRPKPMGGCPSWSVLLLIGASIGWRALEGLSMQVGTHSHGPGRPGNARSLVGGCPGAHWPWPRQYLGQESACGSVGFGT